MCNKPTKTNPRLALLSLTGFGNSVLSALCQAGFPPDLIVTRREKGPYPHYPIEPLPELANRLAIPCLYDAEGEALLASTPPDILLIATYHRILTTTLVSKIDWAINLHPSLLPAGRGPNPFFWAIRNNDKITGVTAHVLTERLDAGPILWVEKLELTDAFTQGELRKKLADLAASGAVALMQSLERREPPIPIVQNEANSTHFGRPCETDRLLTPQCSLEEAMRRFRAWSPYPGLCLENAVILDMRPYCYSAEGSSIHEGWIKMQLKDDCILLRLRPSS